MLTFIAVPTLVASKYTSPPAFTASINTFILSIKGDKSIEGDEVEDVDVDFLGLIAEEVAEVNTYLADYENEDGSGQVENVRYATIVVPLIKAVQELTARVEALEAQINGEM